MGWSLGPHPGVRQPRNWFRWSSTLPAVCLGVDEHSLSLYVSTGEIRFGPKAAINCFEVQSRSLRSRRSTRSVALCSLFVVTTTTAVQPTGRVRVARSGQRLVGDGGRGSSAAGSCRGKNISEAGCLSQPVISYQETAVMMNRLGVLFVIS